jgi:hypothetical protein
VLSTSVRKLISVGMAISGVAIVCFALRARPAAKTRQTDGGLVSPAPDQTGVAAYLGIPFAAPPHRKFALATTSTRCEMERRPAS